MKQVVRSFAIGLFLASIISFVSYKYIAEPNMATHNLTAEELISEIEDMDYKVISDEDYILYSVAKDKAENENENEKKKENKDEAKKKENDKEQENKDEAKKKDDDKEQEEKKDEKVQYTLKIEQGMLANDVSEILKANKIIDDANKLTKYINDNGYGPFLQLGDFKLNSDMTHNEIAEVITKGRKN